MYSAPYGYPNSAAGPAYNAVAPPQNLHLQSGQDPNHQQSAQQQQHQHQQQMMYNPQQQYAMAAASQGHFPPGPGMMPAAGPGAMVQNPSAMMPPHMAAANGQMPYQTPYTTSQYGVPIPSPAGAQMAHNFSPIAGSMPAYVMGPQGMPQQQMMQRMHPVQQAQQHTQPQAAAMGPGPQQRAFNPMAAQAHPVTSPMQPHQAQFSPQQTPQPQIVKQNPPPPQPQSNASQQNSASVTTPQTPTFPQMGPGGNALDATAQTPLSPGSESRDQERLAVLLSINAELMYEALVLQNTFLAHKTENDTLDPSGNPAPRELTAVEKPIHTDLWQVMRRLQSNLQYMASLVDRKNLIPGPSFFTAPPVNHAIRLRNIPPKADNTVDNTDPHTERQERSKALKELYGRLQLLFPGVDHTKEPAYQMPEKKAQDAGHGQQLHQAHPAGQQGQVHNQIQMQMQPHLAAMGQMPGNHGQMPGNHGQMTANHGQMTANHGQMPANNGQMSANHGHMNQRPPEHMQQQRGSNQASPAPTLTPGPGGTPQMAHMTGPGQMSMMHNA